MSIKPLGSHFTPNLVFHQHDANNDLGDLANLSPADRHRRLIEIFYINKGDFQYERSQIERKNWEPPFQMDADNNIPPEAIGAGGAALGGGAVEAGNRILRHAAQWKEGVSRGSFIRHAAQWKEGVSRGSFIRGEAISKLAYPIFAPLVATLSVGAAFYIAATSYREIARTLRDEILDAYRAIGDKRVTTEVLLMQVEEIFAQLEGSYFKLLFTHFNPHSMGYLHLTKGIALDSQARVLDRGGEENHDRAQAIRDEAQRCYTAALNYPLEEAFKDLIHYLYARFCRLSGNIEAAHSQLNYILDNSRYAVLRNIERDILNNNNDEGQVIEDGIPIDFICTITQEEIVQPASYVRNNGHRFYFERIALEQWLANHPNDPFHQPLNADELNWPENIAACETFATAITTWHQTQLKID